MPSDAWLGEHSKAIEVTCLTQVAQDAKRCMAWGAIELIRFTHRMPSTAWPGVQSKAIELTRLPRVAQDVKQCMAWGAIELICLTRVVQSNSPV